MNIIILSRRKFETWPSYHLVYEWEDILAQNLDNSLIKNISKLANLINRVNHKLNLFSGRLLENQNIYLSFEMSARTKTDFTNRKNVIPIIIDFFLTEDQINDFEKAHNRNPVLLITSKEVYDWLQGKLKYTKIVHWPLSLPDKYNFDTIDTKEKIYDFVLFGRQNPVLKSFLQKYSEDHPEIIYVEEGKEKFHYFTNRGKYIGYYKSRQDYIELMKKSRMALYSTPSMDNSRKNSNGFNQVTPKFLEYLTCGCHLFLRYPHNSDTSFFQLSSFGKSINTYEEFEERMNSLYKTNPNYSEYKAYLKNHLTTSRIKKLNDIITETYGK